MKQSKKMSIFLRRFISRYFGRIVEVIYRFKFFFLHFNLPPIIILTPGKVGSSSVYYTLKRNLENPIFHIHRLSASGVGNSVREHLESDRKSIPLHLIVSKLLRKKLETYQGKIFIITLVREPISREVSSFFQNTEFYKNEVEKRLEINTDKAKDLLMQKFHLDITQGLEKWFEEEIKQNFEIDVFGNRFDISKGYLISRNKQYHHLLIKMESLKDYFSQASKELFQFDQNIFLLNANVGGQKHYAESYKKVKNDIKLDTETINQIVSSRYFQHFYAGMEKITKQKWIKS